MSTPSKCEDVSDLLILKESKDLEDKFNERNTYQLLITAVEEITD